MLATIEVNWGTTILLHQLSANRHTGFGSSGQEVQAEGSFQGGLFSKMGIPYFKINKNRRSGEFLGVLGLRGANRGECPRTVYRLCSLTSDGKINRSKRVYECSVEEGKIYVFLLYEQWDFSTPQNDSFGSL